MNQQNVLKAIKWLNKKEIKKNLENVSYIFMVEPNLIEGAINPLHFSIFLNTQESLPPIVLEQVFQKFCKEHHILNPEPLEANLCEISFAETERETAMPMHTKEIEGEKLATTKMFTLEFNADSTQFEKCKNEGLKGWSYFFE